MAEKPNLVHVEIFGQTYALNAGADPGYVEQLAAQVDSQMKDVARNAGVVDTVRIAVLAALNLADECARQRGSTEAGRQQEALQARAKELAQELSAALGE